LRIVKQSNNRASPPPVRKVVSRTSVSSTYRRDVEHFTPSGRIWQNPPRRQSRTRPKQLPESNRGRQHQSIEATSEIRADEWQSPISA